MLTKLVLPGDKIELTAVERAKLSKEEEKKVYITKIFDIESDDRFEVFMPIEQTKLILIPVDAEYEVCFYTKNGIYQCVGRVVDRYKTDGIYIVLFELVTNLVKKQRREYYRYNCLLDLKSRALTEAELDMGKNVDHVGFNLLDHIEIKEEECQEGVIVDISGGGLQFISDYKYDRRAIIYLKFEINLGGKDVECEYLAIVLYVDEIDSRRGKFEHRIKYINMPNREREKIIKFIFEEERRNRQKR